MKLLALFALILAAAAVTGQCERSADHKRQAPARCGVREMPQAPAEPSAPLPVTLRDIFLPR